MSAEALAIFIDAPLQSWGVASQFQRRDTESHPSKSAVLGMVAAALGIDKHASDEPEKLAELSALRFSSHRLEPGGARHGTTRLEDFHTIGGGFDKRNPLEVGHIPRKASGGSFGTVITRRTYLNDAKFVVVLEGDATTLERVSSALADPEWGVWYGRKCCLPGAPLRPTRAADAGTAIGTLLGFINGVDSTEPLEPSSTYLERADGDATYWNDEPVSFGRREYRSRPVRRDRGE